jgi:hypothetical protein
MPPRRARIFQGTPGFGNFIRIFVAACDLSGAAEHRWGCVGLITGTVETCKGIVIPATRFARAASFALYETTG